MKNLAAITALVVTLTAAGATHAGVVVDEQQTLNQPDGTTITRACTVMIEGAKQKSLVDNGQRIIITDLDRGTMTVADSTRKTYVEFPFPPTQPMASMAGGVTPTISFRKTGDHDKVLGYSCDVYSGSGTVGSNSVSMTGCFSDSAPGASDYGNFQRQMADKVKGTAMANMGQLPRGVPLKLAVTTSARNMSMTGVTPERAAKLRQMLAQRHFATSTKVLRITSKTLSTDTFQLPSDYRKQQMPPMMGGVPSGRALQKVPE